ncbi:beta-defensin 108B [Panthera pardus]|uniref:Beta-defensin 108B n=1 Tax=Panthera pardus TaxID=9691 RepID=A0A9V1EW27_PANPR|nr:beta-defensin 108B [Panthera pardus]
MTKQVTKAKGNTRLECFRTSALQKQALDGKSRQQYARGKFKEICEHPNGSCQEFCLEKEVHARQCLNGLTCCLPVGNEPFIKPTTPKER